ncbi:membrane protein insertion efficiency factor YidD [bacterium]|nr:membrane protein insertion efficiency factor YidD [bacterium]
MKISKNIFILLFLIFLNADCSFANDPVGFALKRLKTSNPSFKKDHQETSPLLNKSWVSAGLIVFYQRFISTQDKPACMFDVSCSQFGVMAIRRKGLLKGALYTADRITRCNAIALSYYQLHPKSNKAIDPVIIYEFTKPLKE